MVCQVVSFMETMVSLDYVKMFARVAHEGQVRKYTGEPYVEHVLAVGLMYQSWSEKMDRDALYAAILHDTVEDTEVDMDQIRRHFGDKVAEYVWYLTKPEEFVGNRLKRKALDRARLALAPDVVKFIKILDITHNATSIRKYDQDFWKEWREETLLMLDALDARRVWYKMCNHRDHGQIDKLYDLLYERM